MVPGAAGSAAAAADGGGAARWVPPPPPPVSSSPIWPRGRAGPGHRGPAGLERRPRTGVSPRAPRRRSLQVLPGGRLPAPQPLCQPGSSEAPLGCGRCGVGSPGRACLGFLRRGPQDACLSGRASGSLAGVADGERRPEPTGTHPHFVVTPAGLSPNGAFDLRNPRVELGRGRTKRTVGETERERERRLCPDPGVRGSV